MANSSKEPEEPSEAVPFVTAEHYIVGAGESVEEIRDSGKWIATDAPVDPRR